jgi:protocatechuate 3,4-dioxygenase beta subunit
MYHRLHVFGKRVSVTTTESMRQTPTARALVFGLALAASFGAMGVSSPANVPKAAMPGQTAPPIVTVRAPSRLIQDAPVAPRGNESLRLRLVDDANEPVANAKVLVFVEHNADEAPWEGASDAHGDVMFTTLLAGPYRLEITGDGVEPTFRRQIREGAEPYVVSVLRTAGLVVHARLPEGSSEEITIVLAGSGMWPPAERPLEPGTTETRFGDLPAGVYEVRARGTTLVSAPLEGIELAPGQTADVSLEMRTGEALRLRIIDADTNEPLAGALAQIRDESLSFGTVERAASDDGNASFENLVGGRYEVVASHEGYANSPPKALATGDRTYAIALRRESVVSGVVLDSRGVPVEGARIELSGISEAGARMEILAPIGVGSDPNAPMPSSGGLGVTMGAVPRVSAAPQTFVATASHGTEATEDSFRTDPEGRFRIRALPAGRFTVTVTHPGHPAHRTRELSLRSGREVDVGTVTLRDGGTLEGRVLDPRGFGVPFVRLELSSDLEAVPRGGVSAEDGTFRFDGVSGELVLSAYPSGAPPARLDVVVPGRGTTTQNVTLEQGVHALHGRVVDERGYPIANAHVRLRSLRARVPFVQATTSENDGTFALDALPAPPYALDVDHPDYASPSPESVQRNEDVTVVLRAAFAVSMRIVDDSGEPVDGAHVYFVSDALARTGTSGPEGTVEIRRVSNGNYDVFVDSDRHSEWHETRRLEAPRHDDVLALNDVTLRSTGAIEGVVTDRWNEPVRGAAVTASGGASPETMTDEQGTFVLTRVAAGDHELVATHPTLGTARSRPARVEAGEEAAHVELRFEEGLERDAEPEPTRPDPVGAGATLRVSDEATVAALVAHGSRAEEAGLRRGDRVVAIDGRAVRDADDAARRLRSPSGQTALVELERGPRRLRVFVERP